MTASHKLTFEDREALQLVLGAVGKDAKAIERQTGVSIHVRGNVVSLDGEDPQLVARMLQQMYALASKGAPFHPGDVMRALAFLGRDPNAELSSVLEDTVLVKPADGKAIVPRTLAQKAYVSSLRRRSLTFGVGPAGTGKTFLAIAMAIQKQMDREVRRIVLSRPAIEAGERLGFLPGTLEDKISPYLRPLYDGLHEMLGAEKVLRMIEQDVIEIAPLAYMRGRTLNDAFVILDESQNTTREQMKMFLTRIGHNTKVVVTGDPSQVDLPGGHRSGLAHALRVLQGVEGIGVCRFAKGDVMRHPLVQSIVEAYDRDARNRAVARSTGPAGPPEASSANPESSS